MRTLTLTHPPEQGPDIARLQQLLRVAADGIYGTQTATAVYRRKIELGYEKPDHTAGDLLLAYLTGTKHPTAAMRARAAKNAGKTSAPGSSSTAPNEPLTHEQLVRQNCVAIAHLLLANAARIHYPPGDRRTTSRIHQIATRDDLDHALDQSGGLTLDCSQTVSLIAHVAGANCPDGDYAKNWAADGYTGTLLDGCDKITATQVQRGDFHVYGAGTGHHVAMALEHGPNPLMISHGSDPIRTIRDSDEVGYQPAGGAWLRLPTE